MPHIPHRSLRRPQKHRHPVQIKKYPRHDHGRHRQQHHHALRIHLIRHLLFALPEADRHDRRGSHCKQDRYRKQKIDKRRGQYSRQITPLLRPLWRQTSHPPWYTGQRSTEPQPKAQINLQNPFFNDICSQNSSYLPFRHKPLPNVQSGAAPSSPFGRST